MKPNFSLIFIFILLFSSFVSAVPSFTFRQATPVDLKISCFDINNSLCNNATSCFLKIDYPNSTNLVSNASLTYNYDYFNYSLGADQTRVSGIYSVITRCEGTQDGFSTFTYEVTPTGKPEDSVFENSILIVLGLFSFIVLGFGLYTQNTYLGFASGMMFMLLGVYTMIFGFNDITNLYTRGFASTIIGLGLFFTIVSAYEWTQGD